MLAQMLARKTKGKVQGKSMKNAELNSAKNLLN